MIPSPPPPPRAKLVMAFASIYLIWGSTYLAIRYAIETIPPLLMGGVRFLIAGAFLYLLATRRAPERPTRRHWASATIAGALLFLGGNGSLSWAELRVPTGLAALILSIIPLWMVLLGSLERHGVKLRPSIVAGLVLGVAGIALLVGPSELLGGRRVDPLGAGVLLFGSLCWAGGSLYARRAALPASSLLAAALEMCAGGALMVAVGLLLGEGERFTWAGISARSALGLAYLIVFGALVGFTSYNWLLGKTTPARLSTYAYVNPVIAVFLGWIIGGERVTPRTILAAVIIIGAVVLIITHPSPAPEKKGEETTRTEEEAATIVPCD